MSGNNERLNEALVDMLGDEKISSKVRLKKAKYMVALGADVNARVCGKSVLSWVLKDEDREPEIVEFLKEKGGEEWEISKEEAYALGLNFWDENGKLKSVEEIKDLVRLGANLRVRNKYKQIWSDLSLQEMNEILKILPRGYEIDGDVVLDKCELKELPDFSKVKVMGDFSCANNQLITLKGAPDKVGGRFYCSFNQLTTLKGGPEKVGKFFQCAENKLTTLEGAPQKVGTGFDCSKNQLTTLEWAPKEVGGSFYCCHNKLASLKGAPQKVGGDFRCENNQLVSLKGKPHEIGGEFVIEEEVRAKIEENVSGKKEGGLSRIFKSIFSKDGR